MPPSVAETRAAAASWARQTQRPVFVTLAEEGMVAVHVLVPAADVWRLLPQLEAAGASSILIVPVERMAA